MARLRLNKQKQWTYDSTGSGIANANNNSNSTGVWRPGKQNYADNWTKHDTSAHHVNIRPEQECMYFGSKLKLFQRSKSNLEHQKMKI
jgi:hypothetical protein